MEENLPDKFLKRTSFAHIIGDPASVDALKQAGIADAQVRSPAVCTACVQPAARAPAQ